VASAGNYRGREPDLFKQKAIVLTGRKGTLVFQLKSRIALPNTLTELLFFRVFTP
jgi:hypothetical protein